MSPTSKLTALIVGAVVIAAACSASIASPGPTANPSPVVADARPSPKPSLDRCAGAVKRLAAFGERIVGDMAGVRSHTVASPFRASEAVAAIRRVKGTVAAYGPLQRELEQCDDAEHAADRLEALVADIAFATAPAASVTVTNAKAHRDAAVALFGVLPALVALLEAGQAAAEPNEIFDVVLADAGALAPIGRLTPLPTTSPRPTARPAVTPMPASSTPRTAGWSERDYRTAVAYADSVETTYRQVYSTALDLWGLAIYVPGFTREEIDAHEQTARMIRSPGVKALNRHLAFMANNAAPACLRDAYGADKPIARAWVMAFESYNYPNESTPEGRAALYDWQDLLDRTDALLSSQNRYFKDCG